MISYLLSAMPISARQWRMAVGRMNANKRCPEQNRQSQDVPCRGEHAAGKEKQGKRRETVKQLLTVLNLYFGTLWALIFDTMFGDYGQKQKLSQKMKKKGLQGSLVVLLQLLLFFTALLLLMGGDVERNPGPF